MRAKRSISKPSQPPISLRTLLLETRAKKGLTQAMVVKRLGCTPTTYKAWEKGQRPHAQWYVGLSELCGVTLSEVVGLVTAARDV